MGTDYHRGPSESIPTQAANRPEPTHAPPQGHYSADTGEWNGQLPHTEILQSTEPDYPDYPSPVTRRRWATTVGINFNLSGGERAILQAYAHDCGTPEGCWKSAATMSYELGYNEDFIRDARKKLLKIGVLKDQGRRYRAQRVTLNMSVTGSDTRLQENPAPAKPGLTPGYKNQTGSHTRLQDAPPQTKPGVTPGYEDQTGCHTRSKPGVTPGKLKGTEREEREYIDNLSLNSGSSFSSPGVTPGFTDRRRTINDDQALQATPATESEATESEVTPPAHTPEQERIRAVVVENWPLLAAGGWLALKPALDHYLEFGLTYLHTDLKIKQEELHKKERNARTCVHCNTVHQTPDQVEKCPRCEKTICSSRAASCRQNTCFRKPSDGGDKGPPNRFRR